MAKSVFSSKEVVELLGNKISKDFDMKNSRNRKASMRELNSGIPTLLAPRARDFLAWTFFSSTNQSQSMKLIYCDFSSNKD